MKAPQRASQDHQPAPPLESMATIGLTYWQALIAGSEPPRTHPAFVPEGWYRWTDRREKTKKDIPVQIWVVDGKKWVREGDNKAFRLKDAAHEEDYSFKAFASYSRKAIAYEVYTHWMDQKAWPADQAADAIAASEAPREGNGEPHEIQRETLTDLQAEFRKWFEGLGGAAGPGIQTQDDADRAGNFADRFAELEREAKTTREGLRKPLQEQLDEIQKLWKPIQDDADEAKRFAKQMVGKFLQAETARKLAEAAAEAAKALVEGKPIRNTAVSSAKAGTRGRAISTRIQQRYVCDDYAKVRDFLLKDPAFLESPALASLCGNWANEMLRAGKEVPGARLEDVATVA